MFSNCWYLCVWMQTYPSPSTSRSTFPNEPSDLMQQRKNTNSFLFSSNKSFSSGSQMKTPVAQPLPPALSVPLHPHSHLPTLPSLWSVFGSAMMAWTATMASLILVWSSLSSSMCSRRRIWAASFRVASEEKKLFLTLSFTQSESFKWDKAQKESSRSSSFLYLKINKQHSPPVSKPRVCLSKATATPWDTQAEMRVRYIRDWDSSPVRDSIIFSKVKPKSRQIKTKDTIGKESYFICSEKHWKKSLVLRASCIKPTERDQRVEMRRWSADILASAVWILPDKEYVHLEFTIPLCSGSL